MTRALAALLMLSCADGTDPCADRRDLQRSEAGLTVTRDEHVEGWGRADCATCHPAGTFHDVDCLDDVTLDIDALSAVTAPEDCVACHGDNGVDAWSEASP